MSLAKLDNLDMKGADLASAAALLVNVPGDFHDITGSVTITSLEAVSIGTKKTLQLDAAPLLTHHATNLILPGLANIQGAAGDVAKFVQIGASSWCCTSYTKADGTAVASGAAGIILQVLQAVKTDTATLAAKTWTDITGLSVAITPASTANKINVSFTCVAGGSGSSAAPMFRIVRDSTPIGVGAAAGSRLQVTGAGPGGGGGTTVSGEHLDSPATVSEVTYKIQWRRLKTSGTCYLNRTDSDTDNDENMRAASSITVEEVKG